jgi:hypothetical protein
VSVSTPFVAPSFEQLEAQLCRLIKRIMNLLTRRGFLIEEQGLTYMAEIAGGDSALAARHAAACTYRIALGPRAGQKVLTLQTVASEKPPHAPQRGVNAHGFSLHAATRCDADQRDELERLCRYITRPAIANERLSRNNAGDVVIKLKSPYLDEIDTDKGFIFWT